MQMSKVTNRVKSPEGIIGKAVLYAILMVVLVLLFRNIFLVTYVPSSSMEDTLEPGDLVFGTRYDAQEIERYDVMVFQAVDEDVCYVKRVIGLPGETIKVENGKVYADGIELDDSFVKGNMDSSGDGTFKVPEGSYFMMGDNRNHSSDSRFWETPYVPAENMVGHAKVVFLPLQHLSVI